MSSQCTNSTGPKTYTVNRPGKERGQTTRPIQLNAPVGLTSVHGVQHQTAKGCVGPVTLRLAMNLDQGWRNAPSVASPGSAEQVEQSARDGTVRENSRSEVEV